MFDKTTLDNSQALKFATFFKHFTRCCRYSCECVPGFTGQHCETNINECASSPCANRGVCTDLENGFRCDCPRGYYGPRCLSDVDECSSNPCMNNGTCEDGVNFFTCICPPGFEGKFISISWVILVKYQFRIAERIRYR